MSRCTIWSIAIGPFLLILLPLPIRLKISSQALHSGYRHGLRDRNISGFFFRLTAPQPGVMASDGYEWYPSMVVSITRLRTSCNSAQKTIRTKDQVHMPQARKLSKTRKKGSKSYGLRILPLSHCSSGINSRFFGKYLISKI
jgi:hypothetical protein